MKGDRAWLMTGALFLFIGSVPFLVGETARVIADTVGCTADAGEIKPCLLFGHDVGSTLYEMLRWFWLELLAGWLIPVGLIAIAVGFVKGYAEPES